MTCGPLLLAWTICVECGQSWPCATEQAVAQALAVPDAEVSTGCRGQEI